MNGDLRAETRLAGEDFQFHRAVGDLADLKFEKSAHKIRMAAGKDDFRSAIAALHRDHIGAQAVADIVFLGEHTLAGRHDAFEFPEIDDHIRALEAANRACHNLAGAIFELVINHFPLDLAKALVDRLTGCLSGDAAEIAWRHLDLDLLARLGVGLDGAGLGKQNLLMRAGDFFSRDKLCHGTNGAALRIDLDAELAGARGETFFRSRQDGCGNSFHEDIAFDALLTLQQVQHCDEFGIHKIVSAETESDEL